MPSYSEYRFTIYSTSIPVITIEATGLWYDAEDYDQERAFIQESKWIPLPYYATLTSLVIVVAAFGAGASRAV
jgi:hypothetical protein